MKSIASIRIALLKREARARYQHMQSVAQGYDCGHELTKHMSADYSDACHALNATLDKLAKIDPDAPTRRY